MRVLRYAVYVVGHNKCCSNTNLLYFSFTEALHWHRCEQGKENRLETMQKCITGEKVVWKVECACSCRFCKFHLVACWAGFKQLLIGLGKHSIVEEVPP